MEQEDLQESDDQHFKKEMIKNKKYFIKKIEELEAALRSMNSRIADQENRYDKLATQLSEAQSQLGILLSELVKLRTVDHRKSHGGQIDAVQHQDLLSRFKDLSRITDSLARQFPIAGKDILFQRCGVRSLIARVFTEELDYEAWFNGLFANGELAENKTQELLFREFYNNVTNLKLDMKKVQPVSSFYVPVIEQPFDPERQEVVSEKCDRSKKIALVVVPGLMRGERIDEKAFVYTGLSAQFE